MLKVIERIITEGDTRPAYIKVDLAQVPDAEVVEIGAQEFGATAYAVGDGLQVKCVVNDMPRQWIVWVDGWRVDEFTFPQPGQCAITLVVANVYPQAHIPLQPQPGRDRVQLIINGITVYTN